MARAVCDLPVSIATTRNPMTMDLAELGWGADFNRAYARHACPDERPGG